MPHDYAEFESAYLGEQEPGIGLDVAKCAVDEQIIEREKFITRPLDYGQTIGSVLIKKLAAI
jgi:hypothetical protein